MDVDYRVGGSPMDVDYRVGGSPMLDDRVVWVDLPWMLNYSVCGWISHGCRLSCCVGGSPMDVKL